MNDTTVIRHGQKLSVQRHWLYLRKCDMPAPRDKDGKVLVHLPDHAKQYADRQYSWHDVLAKGKLCGTYATGKEAIERKAAGIPLQLDDVIEIGDQVLTPSQPWKMAHSPYSNRGDEFLMDEGSILLVYTPELNHYQPMGDFVMVEMMDEEDEKNGMALPDVAQTKQTKGVVHAVGSGWFRKDGTHIPLDVSIGDVVLLPLSHEQAVVIDGKRYQLIKCADIFCVLES